MTMCLLPHTVPFDQYRCVAPGALTDLSIRKAHVPGFIRGEHRGVAVDLHVHIYVSKIKISATVHIVLQSCLIEWQGSKAGARTALVKRRGIWEHILCNLRCVSIIPTGNVVKHRRDNIVFIVRGRESWGKQQNGDGEHCIATDGDDTAEWYPEWRAAEQKWCAAVKLGAIQQFIGDVAWGELDAMIIDFPPGSSDEPLTVAQSLPNIDGVVVVTTPQEVALLDSRKSINFAETVKVPVLGIIENMSGYTLTGTAVPNSDVTVMGPNGVPIEVQTDDEGAWSVMLDLFKQGGGEKAAEELGVPFLGRLPFDPGIVRGGDDGVHRIIADPDGEAAKAFEGIVNKLLEGMSASTSSPLKII